MEDETRDNIEVRLHKDGSVDEIVMYDPHTDKCIFHLEKMDDHYFWMRFNGTTQDLVAYFIAQPDQKALVSYDWDDPPKEDECGEEFRTPEIERLTEVSNLINRYGMSSLLKDMATVYAKGRKANHETNLVENLLKTQEQFVSEEKTYWDMELKKEKDGFDP